MKRIITTILCFAAVIGIAFAAVKCYNDTELKHNEENEETSMVNIDNESVNQVMNALSCTKDEASVILEPIVFSKKIKFPVTAERVNDESNDLFFTDSDGKRFLIDIGEDMYFYAIVDPETGKDIYTMFL